MRESHRTAWVICILIFTCVPMTYLLETFVGDLPPAIAEALASVPSSTAWKGVSARGDADGIVVHRKPVGEQGWMPDLWLAERIADALSASRPGADLDPS